MAYRQRQPVTAGIFDLTDAGTSPVTIRHVSLPSARRLTMTEAWVVPILNNIDIGAGWPYPPAYSAKVRAAWAKRRPAVGGVIRAAEDLNLVFGLTFTSGRDGRSAGPMIAYTANGTSYTVQEKTSLIVARTCEN